MVFMPDAEMPAVNRVSAEKVPPAELIPALNEFSAVNVFAPPTVTPVTAPVSPLNDVTAVVAAVEPFTAPIS